MKTFISALTKIALAILILIQKGDDGGPLINAQAHTGLGFVAIALLLWAIFEVTTANVGEDDEDIDWEPWIQPQHTPTIYDGPGRNDHQCSALKSVFQHEGSFGSLNDRHL